MASPFVVPDVVRLDLPDGEWIEVKKELTFGEQQDMFTSMRRQLAPGEPPVLDPARIAMCRMQAYILAWSFTENGRSVPVSMGAMRQLRIPMAMAIREALEKHDEDVQEEHEAEKKTPTGEPAPSLTLLSAK
jgi:hypothetical protein